MVSALYNTESNGKHLKVRKVANIHDKNLNFDECIPKHPNKFFEILKKPLDFFDLVPVNWDSDYNYLKSRDIIKSLQVVNDRAKRCVAVITAYNCILTNNDNNLRQGIVKIVKKI